MNYQKPFSKGVVKMSFISKRKLIIVYILIFLNIIFSVGLSYAYWADSIQGNGNSGQSLVSIGDWGVPIFTAQQFYDVATNSNSNSTDAFYLANDIDFSGFNWTYDANIYNATFKGKIDGKGHTISNLTITNNDPSYLHLGIFARVDGAKVSNLILDHVHLETDIASTSLRAGLLGGTAIGGPITYDNIRVEQCSVIGTNSGGVGGLLGQIRNTGTEVILSNIKVNQLKVFNSVANVGGLVGRINAGASLYMNDIDFLGDIYSDVTTNNGASNAGGLLGYALADTYVTIERSIVEATFQNTLVTDSNYLGYANRYLGGFIGRNSSLESNVYIVDSFFTGSLYSRTNLRRSDVGTVIGNNIYNATLSSVFYAYVSFRATNGSFSYTETGQTGQMSTVVSSTSMPSQAWWDSAYAILYAADPLWEQTPVTGRPYLNIFLP